MTICLSFSVEHQDQLRQDNYLSVCFCGTLGPVTKGQLSVCLFLWSKKDQSQKDNIPVCLFLWSKRTSYKWTTICLSVSVEQKDQLQKDNYLFVCFCEQKDQPNGHLSFCLFLWSKRTSYKRTTICLSVSVEQKDQLQTDTYICLSVSVEHQDQLQKDKYLSVCFSGAKGPVTKGQ